MSDSRTGRTRSARPPVVAVELSGSGHHAAAWRRADSHADHAVEAQHWVDLASDADQGGLDLAFVGDTFGLTSAASTGTPSLDSVAIATKIAGATSRIGLVPTATLSHTEPVQFSKAIVTLDQLSHGRAACQVEVAPATESLRSDSARWAVAADTIATITDLWEIRGGNGLSRRAQFGAPPIASPILVVRSDSPAAFTVAAARADVVRIKAPDLSAARRSRENIRAAAQAAGRDPDEVLVLLDVEALVAPTSRAARGELAELNGWLGHDHRPQSVSYIGSPRGLAGLIADIRSMDVADGVSLQPLALPSVLEQVIESVVPALKANWPSDASASGTSLRDRLGLRQSASVLAASA